MKITNYIKSSKKFDVEELLQFIAEQLGISEEVELTVMYNDRLLDRLSKDIEFQALLQNPVGHKYLLMIREDAASLQYILCHEMVHLSQYESGRLKMSSDYKTVTWEGKEFDNTSNYFEREWEEEARSEENRLWKLFKKSKKE